MPEYFPRPVEPPARLTRPLRVGLLGSQLAGSLSPAIHHRAAERAGVPLEFHLLEQAEDADPAQVLARLHREQWDGFSVTMPWKTRLESALLGMSPDAISIGGVNLLLRADQGWIGENSDAEGFLMPLARRRSVFSSALVIGTGGAARAVLHVLASMPFVEEVWVRGRDMSAAQRLVEEFGLEPKRWTALDWDDRLPAPADLVVNATPLGTEGILPGQLPCPEEWITPRSICYDLVYRPRMTPLLALAGRRGARVIEGLEMLLAQARRAFECWTGREFDEHGLWLEFGLDAGGAPPPRRQGQVDTSL